MSERCYFVSDLHMFSRRSQVDRWQKMISDASRNANLMVLGGDIFDFRWSTLESVDASIDAAIRWIEEVVAENPNCQFRYVLGNHDFNQRFTERLSEFAKTYQNLEWHYYFVREGNCLFLHGDVADRWTTHEQLISRRAKWLPDETRHLVSHHLYDMAIALRLHKAVSRVVHIRSKVIRRLLHYLDDIGETAATGLENVYFGHTHAIVNGVAAEGIHFYNGGAPFAGLPFNIVPVDLVHAERPKTESSPLQT